VTGRTRFSLTLAGALVAVTACAPGAVQGEAVWLMTEGEAALASAPVARAPLPNDGPVIKIITPQQGAEVTSPFPIEIQFEPRQGGALPKMDTLKLTALKIFEIDITDRVKPYVGESRLFVKEAKIPTGRHRLKLTIEDAGGRQTGQILEVTVK
jgi:hypothetical protein